MKRVSFIFVILSLALGLQAQTNPKIASLVDKVYSIEGSHVTFVCAYNGTYYESVTVFVESNPDARSFKFANDSITQLTDSLKTRQPDPFMTLSERPAVHSHQMQNRATCGNTITTGQTVSNMPLC